MPEGPLPWVLFAVCAFVTVIALQARSKVTGRPFGSLPSSCWAIGLVVWIAVLCTAAGLFLLQLPLLAAVLPISLVKRLVDGSGSAKGANLRAGEARISAADAADGKALSTLLAIATLGIKLGLERLDAEMTNTINALYTREGCDEWPLIRTAATSAGQPTLDERVRTFRAEFLSFLTDQPAVRKAAEREFDVIDHAILVATTSDTPREIQRADYDARFSYRQLLRMAYRQRFRVGGTRGLRALPPWPWTKKGPHGAATG